MSFPFLFLFPFASPNLLPSLAPPFPHHLPLPDLFRLTTCILPHLIFLLRLPFAITFLSHNTQYSSLTVNL